MPAKSAKQERFMRAVAHSPSFAKKVGVPMSVGREFTKAEGGEMKEPKGMMKKELSFMEKKGAPKSMIKHEKAEMKGMKKGGMAKYAKGGTVGASSMGAVKTAAPSRDGVAVKGKTRGKMVTMAGAKGMKKGGYC
jgi:hypothetical protein